MVAAILSHFVGFELDGWMGLGVAVFILYSGFGLVKDTLDPMLGKAPEDEQVEEIRQKILSYPGVLGTHDLMVIFDCVVPHNMDMTDKEVKKAINDMVKEKYPTYYCVITIDKSYAAMPH